MKSTGTQSSGDLQWLDKVGRVPEYKWQTHSSLVCIYCPHQFWIKFELWCRVGLGTVTWCIIVMYCHDSCYDMIILYCHDNCYDMIILYCHDSCYDMIILYCHDSCHDMIILYCHDSCYDMIILYCHDSCYDMIILYCHDSCYDMIILYCHDSCYDMIIISSKRQKWCIFYFQTTYLQPQIQSCLINSSSVRCRCSLKLIWISFHGHIFRAFHMKSPLDGFHKTLMMSQYWFK